MKIKLSVLDLCPLLSGHDSQYTFSSSVDLAQFVEQLGFTRFWFAEHHNMPGILSSAPEVLITHVAAKTTKLRIGSGGIMLPNHASLHMAEVFRTLEALYPSRIDFGVGRAPGSGSKATQFLRGARGNNADNFPEELDQVLNWFKGEIINGVTAAPQMHTAPETWILGSSEFGALFAAKKGLPYSFAQHFSHLPALEIFKFYHSNFAPSEYLDKPKAMMGCHIICAETDEEAHELALSSDLQFSIFVGTGNSIPLPTIDEAKAYPYSAEDWRKVQATRMPKFVGSPATIKKQLTPYIESGLIEELMVLSMIHNKEKKKHSYRLLSKIFL